MIQHNSAQFQTVDYIHCTMQNFKVISLIVSEISSAQKDVVRTNKTADEAGSEVTSKNSKTSDLVPSSVKKLLKSVEKFLRDCVNQIWKQK